MVVSGWAGCLHAACDAFQPLQNDVQPGFSLSGGRGYADELPIRTEHLSHSTPKDLADERSEKPQQKISACTGKRRARVVTDVSSGICLRALPRTVPRQHPRSMQKLFYLPALLFCLCSGLLGREIGAGGQVQQLQLRSSAFEAGATMPERYTCAGAGISPPLAWSRPPEGTRSLALLFEKHDDERHDDERHDEAREAASDVALWLVLNLPPGLRSLPEGAEPGTLAGDGIVPIAGVNDFGTKGYDGPCPAVEGEGQYTFRLYALDAVLRPGDGVDDERFRQAISGRILAQGNLSATYQHQAK